MPSMLRCCLRVCFDDTAEDPEDSQSAPQSNRMIRVFQAADDDEVDGDEDCCRTNETSERTAPVTTSTTATTTSNRRMSNNSDVSTSLRQFWRTFRERLNLDTTESSDSAVTAEQKQQKRDETIPILTQASSFDSSKDIPTILSEQVVLPGSELQAKMALAMSAKLEVHDHDDECVICMDGFDPTNPRMPTLCGCGENKTYFHLPCLYQWIEQSRNCPSCAKRLRWEEF